MSERSIYSRIGLGGIAADETNLARRVHAVLHWLVMGATILSAVAFYMDEIAEDPQIRGMASVIDTAVMLTFFSELVIMLALVRDRVRYLRDNWMNLALILTLTISISAQADDWLVLVRLLRLAAIGFVFARLARELRTLTPSSAPFLLLTFAGLMGASGLIFSWIEPTVHSFGQGLWLAFTSAATVGYGDLVPTTTASRIFSAVLVVSGVSLLSMATASLAAFFIGQEEARLRRELHRDVKLLVTRLERMEARQMDLIQGGAAQRGAPGRAQRVLKRRQRRSRRDGRRRHDPD